MQNSLLKKHYHAKYFALYVLKISIFLSNIKTISTFIANIHKYWALLNSIAKSVRSNTQVPKVGINFNKAINYFAIQYMKNIFLIQSILEKCSFQILIKDVNICTYMIKLCTIFIKKITQIDIN